MKFRSQSDNSKVYTLKFSCICGTCTTNTSTLSRLSIALINNSKSIAEFPVDNIPLISWSSVSNRLQAEYETVWRVMQLITYREGIFILFFSYTRSVLYVPYNLWSLKEFCQQFVTDLADLLKWFWTGFRIINSLHFYVSSNGNVSAALDLCMVIPSMKRQKKLKIIYP